MHRYSTSTTRLNSTSIVVRITTTPMMRKRSLLSTPTDQWQTAGNFEAGQLLSFDVLRGTRFEEA